MQRFVHHQFLTKDRPNKVLKNIPNLEKKFFVCNAPQDDSNVSHKVLPLNLIRIHIFPKMDNHEVDQEMRDEVQLPLIS